MLDNSIIRYIFSVKQLKIIIQITITKIRKHVHITHNRKIRIADRGSPPKVNKYLLMGATFVE